MTFEQYWEKNGWRKLNKTPGVPGFDAIARQAFEAGYQEGLKSRNSQEQEKLFECVSGNQFKVKI